MKEQKPVFISELYKVVKRGGSFVVTLVSSDVVQFSGSKQFAVAWARTNSGMQEDWE